MIRRFVGLLLCALFFFSACTRKNVFLAPPAEGIDEIEGYASLRVTTQRQTTRSRFSFLFSPPEKGRIDVLDPLGRVHYQLFFVDTEAYFVVPGKKAYWQGPEREILEKLFGLQLSLQDVVGLMSGYWSPPGQKKSREETGSWTFLKNRQGRIHSGQSGEFVFEVLEFFGQTSWAREVVFFFPQTEGRIKILNINFNQPISSGAFKTSFKQMYKKKTWEEIRGLLFDAR